MTLKPTSTQLNDCEDAQEHLDGCALLGMLQQQRDLYLQLKQLSTKQSELIEQQASDQLLTLLAKRQGMVDSLGQISHQLLPYRERMSTIAAALDEDSRGQIRELVNEIDQLLQSIIDQDGKDHRQLEAAQVKVGSNLNQITQASTALSAYRQACPASARFTDRKG